MTDKTTTTTQGGGNIVVDWVDGGIRSPQVNGRFAPLTLTCARPSAGYEFHRSNPEIRDNPVVGRTYYRSERRVFTLRYDGPCEGPPEPRRHLHLAMGCPGGPDPVPYLWVWHTARYPLEWMTRLTEQGVCYEVYSVWSELAFDAPVVTIEDPARFTPRP